MRIVKEAKEKFLVVKVGDNRTEAVIQKLVRTDYRLPRSEYEYEKNVFKLKKSSKNYDSFKKNLTSAHIEFTEEW